MIRVLTITLAFLAITVLLASSFATLFSEQSEPGTSKSADVSGVSTDRSLINDRPAFRPAPVTSFQPDSGDVNHKALALSPLSQNALETQVTNQLADYVTSLNVGQGREKGIMNALVQAYKGARALASNTDLNNTGRQDPNYVVNAMTDYLDPQELAELELFLENTSRRQFENTYSSQVDIISSQISEDTKRQLLDTFFAEHYALMNPHGSLAPQNSRDYIARQLEAIEQTRSQLRGGLLPEEFGLVDAFLTEQAEALGVAQNLFRAQN